MKFLIENKMKEERGEWRKVKGERFSRRLVYVRSKAFVSEWMILQYFMSCKNVFGYC